jgi:hypothetical protein
MVTMSAERFADSWAFVSQPNPHLIPRGKATEQLEQSVPSVLDQAAALLTATGPVSMHFMIAFATFFSVPGLCNRGGLEAQPEMGANVHMERGHQIAEGFQGEQLKLGGRWMPACARGL